MKRIALFTVIVLLVLTAALIAWQLRSVLSVFILAIAISAALSGPTDALVQRGWRRPWAMLVTFGGGLGLLLGLVYFISIPTLEEVDPLLQDAMVTYERIQSRMVEGGSPPIWASRLPSTESVATWWSGGSGIVALRNILGVTQGLGNLVAQLALALVLSIYWAADRIHFERLWLSLISPEKRGRARQGWRKFEADVGAYIRSEIAQSILAGALFALGFWLIGVEYPYITALLAALLWLIPFLGFLLSAIVATLVGSLSGVEVAGAALVYTLAVLALMEFVVERWLYPRERYWGVLLVLVMLGMIELLGVIGLLVAQPVAVAAQLLLNNWLERTPESEQPTEPVSLADVKARLDEAV
jgi:putative permease